MGSGFVSRRCKTMNVPHFMLQCNKQFAGQVFHQQGREEFADTVSASPYGRTSACPRARIGAGHRQSGEFMGVEHFIIWLIVGAIAGWLAGMVVRGGGFGLIGDIVVGIIGALIAGWLLPRLGIFIGHGFVAAVIDAFIGAVILLIILRLVRRV
jgi:uncharacterized membrane protein YeaQ/YmgE (transglycosylase-associated protein family)